MRQFRIGLTIALALYAAVLLATSSSWSVIDNVNLPVHEAGHLFFAPLGESMQLLGGTILQLLLPLLFATYFTIHRDEHAASVAIWWVGQNFTNIAVYVGDAQAMELPLVGGGDHDWNLLLSDWGLLSHATQYAHLVNGFGFLVMLVATIWGIFEALDPSSRSGVSTTHIDRIRHS